jgi:hypothetical protein
MWKILGYLAGVAPVVVDLLQHSGAPTKVTGVGLTIMGAVKTADMIRNKRKKGAKPFDSDKANEQVEKMK